MKLLCPTCQKPLEVPEQYAGQMMKCPLCSNPFTVPVLAGVPSPAAAPASPPVMRQESASARVPVPAEVPRPPGQLQGFTVPPGLIPWLAPFSLATIFVLLFLDWVGLYPGGIPVLTQNAWDVAFGNTWHQRKWIDYATDARYLKAYYDLDSSSGVTPPDTSAVDVLRKPNVSVLIILFVLLVIPAALAAVSFLLLHLKLVPLEVPSALAGFWPMRTLFVGGLAMAMLVFLVIEMVLGFPLEHTIDAHVRATVQAKYDQASPGDRSDAQRWEIERGIRKGAFVLQTTSWLVLVVILNTVAVLGCALEFWMERRGGAAVS